jgi:dTDP-4-amino-4,6-dideoxygalactose transaminase
MVRSMPQIPVARPKLPLAERIAPYLKAIDAARSYSNFGPLASSLEERMASHYGLPAGTVTTVANGTWGLTLALAAQGAKPGTLCAMPAWTFVASAHAAVNAGLVPYFIDVDPESWAIEPPAVIEGIRRAPAPVGAVMPVSPFGQPISVAAWDAFRAKTGIPVVIDAAASFDSLTPGATPAVLSLHATKVLATGEGGLVVSTDGPVIRDVRKRSNFGFHGARHASLAATNAKMSEYHAAVGHASLDEWRDVRAQWMKGAAAYREGIGSSDQVRLQSGFGDTWIASSCLLMAPNSALCIERALAARRIETRRWWGLGAHAHPATAHHPRTSLPVTEMLAKSTIGVPFYRDLALGAISKIARMVRTTLEG